MPSQGSIQYATAVATTVGVLGGAYYAYKLYQQKYKQKLPEHWTQVGTLGDIYVYPIKSCGSIKLVTAECSVLGLRDEWLRDRVLMVIDSRNNFITARGYPDMLLVHPTVKNSILTLKHVDMEDININLAEVIQSKKTTTGRVWGVDVPVYDCGREASEWFSKLLAKPDQYRLVYYASQKSRPLRKNGTNKFFNFTKTDTGAFPDEVPFNLVNQASIDDLNTKLGDVHVTPRNFRPNFVLIGSTPYAEDNWKYVKVGENVFEIIKPCTRCILTTIDPETGVRNYKAEPLETLKSYRQIEDPEIRKASGNSPRMGLQMSLRSGPGGMVAINDPIYVA